jgi:hypothetical protein
MTDDQITTLLRDSTEGLEPDVLDLVAGGVARGQRSRRRRRAGTALAAAGLVGALAVAVSIANGPSSIDGQVADSAKGTPAKTKPATPPKSEGGPTPDAALAVDAVDVPAKFAELLPSGNVGPVLTQAPYPVVNEPDQRIAHFLVEGTLTSFIIEPAAGMETCQQQARDAGHGVKCESKGGLDVLTLPPTTADQVTAQSVSVWKHGYIVTDLSYNAAEGKDVAPVMDQPAIGLDKLTEIASSDAWFSWELVK